MPGRVAQSVGHLTRKSGVSVRYPVWQHTFASPSAFSRRAVVSYWRKYVHEVLVNRLGGLSLPRKSVVKLTDRPDMTLDVYRGRKTTMQECNNHSIIKVHRFQELFKIKVSTMLQFLQSYFTIIKLEVYTIIKLEVYTQGVTQICHLLLILHIKVLHIQLFFYSFHTVNHFFKTKLNDRGYAKQ